MTKYRHVNYLWDDAQAPTDPVDLLIYRSNLLGADLRITNYGGGNTSVKVNGSDSVTGQPIQVLWIKGSGGDLGTLRRTGLAALDNGRVIALERGYRGVEHEDHQVSQLADCLVEPRTAAPSIDTPLHALIPYPNVDHVHPDALIALAAADGGQSLVEEVFESEVGWLDWQRPGYDLALKLRNLINSRPGLKGVVLGGHGLISWADTSKNCYDLTLGLIEEVANFLEKRTARRSRPVFGERLVQGLDPQRRVDQAARLLPMLRGLAGDGRPVVGHFRDDESVRDFISRADAPRLAQQGTSCPDHFLRTKQRPLLLDLPPDADLEAEKGRLVGAFAAYREVYAEYYRNNAGESSPPMRSPNPVVILWPGIGMFTMAPNKRGARIAGEFYINAINVMRGAETVTGYQGLPDNEAFRIEYWFLEEAKLRRMPPPMPLTGRVALITGGSGGIGSAIARRFVAEGACVVIADLDDKGAADLAAELDGQAIAVRLDVSDEDEVEAAFRAATLAFGGVDLLVNNAGISISRSLLETSQEDYQRLHDVIDLGSFLVSRAFVRQAVAQGLGGDIIYIVSKNSIVAGPNNVAYSTTKAAQLHQMRLLAAELAAYDIRVNGVNPDAVIQGSRIFAGAWGDDRAATYGVPRERLGEYYAQRTLLKVEVMPADIAAACFVLVAGELAKTTGLVIPVDGGVSAAFLR